jgi:4,5-DOPA dioxygenase extradiol
MPALFVGHGNPMNALSDNDWTRAWAALGARLPRPRAVLAISAHWYLPGTRVTASRVQQLLEPLTVGADETWGLDHGTWSVLCHMYPRADVPVVQLSIDETEAAAFHLKIGTRLRALRAEGILVLGSGDIVHNLHTYSWGAHPREPYDWALRFEADVRRRLQSADTGALVDYMASGADAQLSVPTPEHYLPLLYVLGASFPGEAVSFPVTGMDGGSVSMLAVQFG